MPRPARLLAACIAACIATCLVACAPRTRATPAREGRLTTGDGTRLFYRVVGSAPDTVIAIHGGPGVDLESLAGDFAPLADDDE